MEGSAQERAVAEWLSRLASMRECRVIAKGGESKEMRDQLIAFPMVAFQGNDFAKPASEEQILAWIDRKTAGQ
ncbi:MAG: hypothetical protein IJ189_07135 [Clostridia bacterium]|nr:hypothetical protein [Clostridia bacterium]